MYNILIVDDEYLARNKLLFLLDWNKHGFHISGEASSAAEAIDFIKTNTVDVVFTDVYMPDMDGIQLAEYIHRNYADISVVIFSNYSDFDYVKSAFSANIIDYVLKYTLTEESMVKVLELVRTTRQSNRLNSVPLTNIRKEQEYQAQIKHTVLTDNSDLDLTNVIIAVMNIDNYNLNMQLYKPDEQEMLYKNFENIIATILSPVEDFVIFRQDTNLILYLPFPQDISEPTIMNLIKDYIQQINTTLYKIFGFNLIWGISMLSSSEYSVHQCYLEACHMLANQPSRSKNFATDTELPVANRLSISMEKNLLSAISDLNITKVNQYLEQIFSGVTSSDKVDLLINDLISIAAKFCNEFGIDVPDSISLSFVPHHPTRYLETFQGLFGYIIESRLNIKSVCHKSIYVHSAIEYISTNYTDATISLGDIAKHIGISEKHLSKVFKNETGKNISNFLVEYRIERAKDLLRKKDTQLKYLYSDVGFVNNSYFCTTFKKYTGCSPKEYQKNQVKV